ncbi:MAG: SIS domain-containing protein [Kiritimatiellaeota bacterium]|nr:SIS domain-containing protein [Kiritimatiellota bacterium]
MYSHIRNLLVQRPKAGAVGPELEKAVCLLVECFLRDNALFICGNGGSAADADHIAGELGKGFRIPRRLTSDQQLALEEACGDEAGCYLAGRLQRGVRAFSLNSHVSLMTAVLNDQGGELVFAQQLFAWGRPGDILLGLSTSGNSADIIWAARVALARKMHVIAMTGACGGRLSDLAHIVIRAPAEDTAAVQEWHLPFYHALCAEVECRLFGGTDPQCR